MHAEKNGPAPESSGAKRKTTRRKFIQTGVAMTGGLALSTTYVKPHLLSISLHETAYASGDPYQLEGQLPEGDDTGTTPLTQLPTVSGEPIDDGSTEEVVGLPVTSEGGDEGPTPKPTLTEPAPSETETTQTETTTTETATTEAAVSEEASQPVRQSRPGRSDTP